MEYQFRYRRLDGGNIEIILAGQLRETLLSIARASYESAIAVEMGKYAPHQTPASEVDFSKFLRDPSQGGLSRVLNMDYANGRQCSTFIEIKDGKIILRARLFEKDRSDLEAVLERAQGIEIKES